MSRNGGLFVKRWLWLAAGVVIVPAVLAAPTPTDSASATAPQVSAAIDGYPPVSDVDPHARMSLDVCAIDSLLAVSPTDFAAVAAIYRQGRHSIDGSGAPRTMAKFARSGRSQEPLLSRFERYYGPQWIDAFVGAALEPSGRFASEPERVRDRVVAVAVRDQVLVGWALHEMDAAVAKAERGELAHATGAPHNWDEVFAYYHGVAPRCSAHETAAARDRDFAGGASASSGFLAGMQRGLEALLAGDAGAASRAREDVVRNVTLTYLRSVLRSTAEMDAALAKGRAEDARVRQAEAWAYFRVIEPLVAGADSSVARAVSGALDLSASPARGSGKKVSQEFAKTYAALGLTPADLGRYKPR